jgi:sugar lactone lactonase YvrE
VRPTTRLGVVLASVLLAGLCLAPAQASAAGTRPFLGTFCEPSGIGTAPCSPTFTTPAGLAVDQSTGDVYVIDVANKTVSRYDKEGNPVKFSALAANVIDGHAGEADATPQGEILKNIGGPNAPNELEVAIDNSGGATKGNIYVTNSQNKLIDVFASSGAFLGQLSEFKEGPLAEGAAQPFKTAACGVAVDPGGNVYVSDFGNGNVHKYTPAGAFPTNADNKANYTTTTPCALAAGAGPTAGFLFATRYKNVVSKIDSEGAGEGETKYTVSSGDNTTVAVNPANGRVLAASGKEAKEFDASGPTEAGEVSSVTVAEKVRGIAVNGTSGNLFLTRQESTQVEVFGPAVTVPDVVTKAASEVGTESATLTGTINPNGAEVTECLFEYDTTPPYPKEGPAHGTSVPCEEPDASEVGSGGVPVAVHAKVEGLTAGTTFHYRLVAANTNNPPGKPSTGEDEAFQTLGPLVSAASASQISATGARISGTIDPNGEETSFVVQFVTQAQFDESQWTGAQSSPAAPKGIGSGSSPVAVAQQLSGLQPATAYRVRLLATTTLGEFPGPEGTFTTFAQSSGELPDSRAYELVSPAAKKGEVIPPEPSTNLGSSCSECLPGGNEAQAPMQSAPDGNAVAYAGQPFAEGLASSTNSYLGSREAGGWGTAMISKALFENFQSFSEDLGRGVLLGRAALSEDAATKEGKAFENLYLWEGGAVQALITQANAPPNRTPFTFGLAYGAANAGTSPADALTHIVFAANDALSGEVPGIAPAAADGGVGGEGHFRPGANLYEWFGGELRLVNVQPGNAATVPGAVLGSGKLVEKIDPQFQSWDVDHAISDDGGRIFWSNEGTGQTYLRIEAERTVELPDHAASFLTASADGSQVLLSDGHLYGQLDPTPVLEADLSAGQGGFEGILGASEDLSRIYFVDTAALSGPEENENGEAAQAGKFNLYLWEEGSTRFIGRLLAGDNNIGGLAYGAWKASPSNRTAQVSPDGSYLALMSRAQLTGYDNAGGPGSCGGVERCSEVFEYEAGSGKLLCASCNLSGQRPLGPANLSLNRPIPAFSSLPQPSNLATEGHPGRLFFESQDTLSPHDSNGTIQDVYQYEPEEVGSCEKAGGCISLISSGHSANDSMFMDASPSGEDAFFITREQLRLADKDQRLDLYDARAPHVPGEEVGIGEGTPIAPCAGEACKGPLSPPPLLPGPGSGSFEGPGNPPAPKGCKKGFVKRGGKCVRKKHHRRHHHKRAHRHGRGAPR